MLKIQLTAPPIFNLQRRCTQARKHIQIMLFSAFPNFRKVGRYASEAKMLQLQPTGEKQSSVP